MAIVNQPPISPVDVMADDGTGIQKLQRVNGEWLSFFNAVYQVCLASSTSGATANRPTKILWIGRPYFDTTINKPIWLKTASPVVWVDATGTPV